MFQADFLGDLLSNPVVIQYIIGGIILIVVFIICYGIHSKLTK